MRIFYTLKSIEQLKQSNQLGSSYKDYFQVGKSVDTIESVLTVKEIVQELVS